MTVQEFSNQFDILYNAIATQSAPGIDARLRLELSPPQSTQATPQFISHDAECTGRSARVYRALCQRS